MLFGVVNVIVVIAAADPRDGSSEALERALRSAVGDRAIVVVKSARDGDSDDPANVTADANTVVGVVTWTDHQRRATLRFVHPNGRRSDRELRFDASDVPSERGRTIGFAVASMVPEDEAEPTPPRPAPAPPPLLVPASAPGAPASSVEAPRVPPRDPSAVFALDLTTAGAVGVGGNGGGFGGALAGRIPLGRGFATRLALTARFGEIPQAQATSHAYTASAGLAWQVWPSTSKSFGIGGRVDFLVMRHEVVHLSADDPAAVSRSRFVPGVDVLVEGGIRLFDHAAVVLAAGPEIALGRTNIVVAGREVGVVPPVRLCVEAGVRVSF